MFKKLSIKRLIVLAIILLMTVSTIVSIVVSKKIENYRISLMNPEERKAVTYSEYGENAADVNGTENVKFLAFFLQDLNTDGYAEKVNGKCLEIGTSGTLYMELSVLSEGVLENAQIEINGQNFYLYTAIPRDEEIMNNAISNNTRLIQFNSIQNGTQKMMSGFVRSGNYSSSSSKNTAIGTNINNFSNSENAIILTGTYVDNAGNSTDIRKEIKLTVDWFGENRTSINSRQIQDHSYDPNIAVGTSDVVSLSFEVKTSENLNELLTKRNHVECVIPQLNGYDPISVTTSTGNNITSSYNPETHIFEINKNSVVDDAGNVTSLIATTNTYIITVNYPRDAVLAESSSNIELIIPVSEYYEGYNNNEFENPKMSNIASTSIITNYPLEPKTTSQKLTLNIGKFISSPYYDYVITKTKPYNIYDGISISETNDTYPVEWSFYTGTDGVEGTLTLSETKRNDTQKVDEFITSAAESISLEDITRYKSASFTGIASAIDEDGMIYIINEETSNCILELTKEEALQYNNSNPYIFPDNVKHIRVEVTKTNPETSFGIAFQKELDDEYITNNFTREEFDNLKMVRTRVTAYSDNISFDYLTKSARYEQVQSSASISLDNNVVSTQATERNNHLTINAKGSNLGTNTVGWVNGIFLVKVPNQVAKFNINNCEIDNPRVNLVSYELYENSDGKFIKIYTSNTSPEAFNIIVDYDISADPRIPTQSGNFVLYAKNNISCNYIYRTQDIYDINGNLNTTENVNTSSTGISFVSPSSMITTQMVSQFDGTDTIIISPEIADLEPAYADVDNENKTARIGIQIRNNYSGIIDEVKILGKIPFENNTDVLKNTDLGSSYSAQMKDTGIEVPEELRGQVTVYYSTNENPNNKLTDTSNNWLTADRVTDWTQVKTFLIDFENYSMASGKEFVFYYQVEIPVGLEYNQVAFSHHGVYFSLNTDEGRYRTKIAPNYIGLRIAKKFDLQLIKYQYTKSNTVSGAIYGVREYTVNETQSGNEIIYSGETITQSTNNLGILTFNNLYAERYYEIREIVSPDDYEINPDTIKFIAHVDDDGNITTEKVEGTTKVPIYVTKNENELHKVNVEVEDEVKLGIKVIKSELNTDIKLSKSRFKIIGPNYDGGRIISTNTSGEAILTGLSLGQEYTIQEIKSTEGYYLDNQVITFKVINNGGTYEVETYNGNIKNYTLTTDNNKPVLVLEWENEKIPTYNMVINKISKDEGLPLEGATFKLFYNDKEIGTYVTDAEGKMYINNLYLYVPEKIVEQEYVLKEYIAPEGFATVKDIHFFVKKNSENKLELTSDSISISNQEGTESLITITIEDRKSFVLIKEDEETGERLQGAKFAIYNVDNGLAHATEAVDVRGNRVGNYEVVNGEGYYLVETNAEGMISLLLPEGAYKAVEIVASDEKYDLSNENLNVHYFGIGTNVRFSEPGQYLWSSNAYGEPTMYLDDMEGYVIEGSKKGLRKYNTDGSVMWEFPIGNVSYLFLDTDDKYIVNVGNKIYKYDKLGNVEWENPTSGQVKCMCSNADGGYCAIEGSTLKRYDSTFNVIWTVTGMGTHNSATVREDVEGNIITQVGQSISKFDNTGTRLWNKSVSITIIRDNPASSAMIIDEEGYLIGGQNGSNIVCTKLDPSGNELYTKTIATGFNYTHYTAVNNDNELLFGFEYDNYSGGPGGIYTRPRVAIITADGEVKTMFGVYQNWEGTQGTGSCIYCFGGGRFNYATRLQSAGFVKEDGSTLGANNTIVYSAGSAAVQDTTELIVKNRVKKFRVSTLVEPYEGVKGGSISGDGVYAYELVNYNEENTNDITITPNEGYKILSLTINGEKVPYTPNADGTYTLPRFTNMLEDKAVVVKFIKIENTLIINKEDSETRDKLQGATFRFEQIEERPEPEQSRIEDLIENTQPFYYPDVTQEENDSIGDIVNNGPEYIEMNEDAAPIDTTEIFGELTANGTYYFVKNEEGLLIPTNSKSYQTTVGGTAGKQNSTAYSYIPINLTNVTGNYRVVINAYNQSEGPDYGYATITNSTTAPSYTTQNGRFMYVSGTVNRKNYYSEVLEGGNTYYLHLGYRKDISIDTGIDAVQIYSIELYDVNEITSTTYPFELDAENHYINTNGNVASTKSTSYFPIDLRDKEGKYGIIINAEQSAASNNNGYIAISQNTNNTTNNAIYGYSGNITARDVYKILDGGRMYYVHLTFNNNANSTTYSNTMKINSINLYKAKEMYFSFEKNEEGILTSTNTGYDNSTSYSIIPIDLTGLEGKYNLIINANISSQASNDFGFATITQNTNRVSYNSSTGRIIYISGTSTSVTTPKDYPTVLNGGNMYYLHVGYYKNGSTSTGDDKFYINNIRLELNESELYNTSGTTDENGVLELQLPHGLYNVFEDQAPVGYKTLSPFTYRMEGTEVKEITIDNIAYKQVIVHHYYKDNDGNYTTTKVAEDDLLYGEEGERYSTSPILDMVEYDLEKDNNGDYIIPSNATGTYANTPVEVTYYYTNRKPVIIVNHYIEDTVTRVPLNDGTLAPTETYEGEFGESYSTAQVPNELLSGEYEIAEVPQNATSVYTNYEEIINYYYKKVQREVIINKIDEDGVTKLENVGFTCTNTSELGTINVNASDLIKNDSNYYMVSNNEAIINNNQRRANTTAESYYEIDTSGKHTPITITINAAVSSESVAYDFGYAYVNKTTNKMSSWPNNSEKVLVIGGSSSAKDYTYTFTPNADKYYLHIGYRKDVSVDKGTDTFTVNSITIQGAREIKYTNENGQINYVLETGNYTIEETEPLAGYKRIDSNIEVNIDRNSPLTQTIDVVNEKIKGRVKVNHYKQGTTEPIILSNGLPAESVIKTGNIGDMYVTSPLNEAFSRYELVETPENASGDYIDGEIEVNYYYTAKPGIVRIRYVDMVTNEELIEHDELIDTIDKTYNTKPKEIENYICSHDSGNTSGTIKEYPTEVIYYYGKEAKAYVHYVEKSTNKEIAETDIIRDLEGKGYTTTPKVIKRYRLIETELPTNANGTLKREPTTIIYYYEFDTAFVEVHHLDNITNEDIGEVETIEGAVGDRYNAKPIEIENYDLVEERLPKNASDRMTKETIIVNYYYSRISSVTVKYIDRNTEEELAEPEFIPGHEGEEYHSTAKNIDDYILVEEPEHKDGPIPRDPITITYYYAKESAGVIEKHIYEKNNEVLYNEAHSGNVGDEYDLEPKEFEHYEVDIDKMPGNKHGYMEEEPVEVIFYYKYVTPITVQYIDKQTGEKIIEDIHDKGYEGDKYVTEEKTFDNYQLVEVVEIPKNQDRILTKKEVVVKYYYAHDSAGVRVHYIDEQTNKEIVENSIIPGQEGKDYEATSIQIDNYELDKDKMPTNSKGKMTIDVIDVYYYYKPKAKVIIEYVDKETNEVIEEVTKEGIVGDEYKTNPKYYDYYLIIDEEIPANKDGFMTNEPIIVRYYYHKKAQVVVEYIEKQTGVVIDKSYIYGDENDEYKTTAKDFSGYTVIEDELPENREGTMTRDHITYVRYYYEKGEVEKNIIINNNNNNDITIETSHNVPNETVVVIGDNSSNTSQDATNVVNVVNVPNVNNGTTRNTVEVNPSTNKPVITTNSDNIVITPNNTTSQTTSVVYDVPNTEKNSYYHVGALLLIATGWFIIVKNKQDEE